MINYRKGSVHQGDTKIINVANIRSPKYMKKTLTELKRELCSSTVIAANRYSNFNHRKTGQKISKETEDLNNNMGKLDIIGIY